MQKTAGNGTPTVDEEIRGGSEWQPDKRLADTIDAALESAGCWHRLRLSVTVACVIACVANAFCLMSASLALPSAECDLQLTSIQLGLLNGASFGGMLAGALIWSAASDVVGRRRAIVCSLGIGAAATLAEGAAPGFGVLLLLRCLEGVASGGSSPAIFSYFAEWQPLRIRGMAVSGLSGCWMLGGMLASSSAWLVLPRPLGSRLLSIGGMAFSSWRVYMASCALLYGAAGIAFLLCLPESPVHLFQLGQHEKAKSLLKTMAGKAVKEDSDDEAGVRAAISEGEPHSCPPLRSCRKPDRTTASRLCLVLSSLFDRRHRRRVVLLAAINSTTAFSYYGLLLWFPVLFKRAHQFGGAAEQGGVLSVCSSGSIHGANSTSPFNASSTAAVAACDPDILAATRPYAEAFLVSASNLPGNLISLLLIDRVGRRRLLSASLALMAGSVGLIGVVWSHTQALAFSCAFSALSMVSWNSISAVSVELLPSYLSASALGLCFALARISSLVGTVTFGALIDDGCLAPMTLSAGVLIVGALLVCALPSTRRRIPLDIALKSQPPLLVDDSLSNCSSPTSPQNSSPASLDSDKSALHTQCDSPEVASK